MAEPQFMTVNAAAEVVGLHPETLRRAIRNGLLTCHRRRGCTRITREQLQNYMDSYLCLAKGTTSHISSHDEGSGTSSDGKKIGAADSRRDLRMNAALDRPSRIANG